MDLEAIINQIMNNLVFRCGQYLCLSIMSTSVSKGAAQVSFGRCHILLSPLPSGGVLFQFVCMFVCEQTIPKLQYGLAPNLVGGLVMTLGESD